MKVCLNSVEKVKEFVNLVSKYEDNIDLESGRYVVDAKSIMGIFSLDLSNPITVIVHGEHKESILQNLQCFA